MRWWTATSACSSSTSARESECPATVGCGGLSSLPVCVFANRVWSSLRGLSVLYPVHNNARTTVESHLLFTPNMTPSFTHALLW